MYANNYSDLVAWQKAMDLVEAVYKATRQFPKEEIYGLSSQVRRAAVSIPSNIAEGHERKTRQSFLNFLSIAAGSLNELETQVEIARRLGFVNAKDASQLAARGKEVGRLTNGLANYLKRTRNDSPPPRQPDN